MAYLIIVLKNRAVTYEEITQLTVRVIIQRHPSVRIREPCIQPL